jgi:hypothetical protein
MRQSLRSVVFALVLVGGLAVSASASAAPNHQVSSTLRNAWYDSQGLWNTTSAQITVTVNWWTGAKRLDLILDWIRDYRPVSHGVCSSTTFYYQEDSLYSHPYVWSYPGTYPMTCTGLPTPIWLSVDFSRTGDWHDISPIVAYGGAQGDICDINGTTCWARYSLPPWTAVFKQWF